MIRNESDAMCWIIRNCSNPNTLESISYDWIIIKKKPTVETGGD